MPFPGWTLPGVFGAGGLQALVKGGLNIDNNRVVVAGTGPLLLAVADYLKSKGANVLAIVEQAQAGKIRRFARSLWRHPYKVVEAAAIRSRLIGVPYWADSWVARAHGREKLKGVDIVRRGRERKLECDLLACGFHLVPNIELATLLGCRIENGFVAIDEFQQTSLANIFCAGEPTAIGGVEASIVEGKIAGYAAVSERAKARELFSKRESTNRFTVMLNSAFTLRDELRRLPEDDTVVCRCEDVKLSGLRAFASQREAKLQTRCGMGACQGRICGPATEFLLGWAADTVRPPIFPVKLENL
jgi:NADPH-dependent 2,4-dienoyl-CoA reductase/sulfur reductase-like enzyme